MAPTSSPSDYKVIKYFSVDPKTGRRGINTDLLLKQAEALGKELVDEKLSTTQLRRFYQSVQSIRRELESDEMTEADIKAGTLKARLALLRAHAHYAHGQDRKKFPERFLDFIKQNVQAVSNKEDFLHGFVPYFEAVVAYHRFFEAKKKGGVSK